MPSRCCRPGEAKRTTGRPAGRSVAASHGNLIALALNSRDAAVGFETWDAMEMPALYEIHVDAGEP